MRVIQHVVSNTPKWVAVLAAGPQTLRTLNYRVSQHCESRVVLSFQHRSHRVDRIDNATPRKSIAVEIWSRRAAEAILMNHPGIGTRQSGRFRSGTSLRQSIAPACA